MAMARRFGVFEEWIIRIGTFIFGAIFVIVAINGFLRFEATVDPYIAPFYQPVLAFTRVYVSGVLIQLLTATLIILTAAVLFFIRSRARRLYATIEILFGVLASMYVARQIYEPGPNSGIKAVFATVAGIYIVVRGFDNWQQASKEGPLFERFGPIF
jgi:hypothetical protein